MIADRYSLDREIGRGGMGSVWLATDEVLGRRVAVKKIGLLPGASSTDLARAEREARLAARLNHHHVVAVFNLVVEDDERWLVMEYVDGDTLAERVRRDGPMTPDEAARLLRQAAVGLVAAHEAGVVHRDVKPSNILLDKTGVVKLTDFGIAHVATDASLTQTGLVSGSPAYLAPEVASGERASAASDVWSLGATLFHLLSGHPPYDMGDHVLSGLVRLVNEEPPRLRDAGWLTPLLEGTMEKDPARRWSMTEVRDFLTDPASRTRPAVRPVPPVLAPTPDDGRSSRPPARAPLVTPRERSWLLALVAVAVVVVLGLVLFAVLPDDDPTEPADVADSPASQAPSDEPADEASPTDEPQPTTEPAEVADPTAQGMGDFIRGYVAAISEDPTLSFAMLTPSFQQQSGGIDQYRDFWDGVGQGQVLDIESDPDSLVVSYRVRFDNFGTGQRPTVLQLTWDGEQYLIDGETTEGS